MEYLRIGNKVIEYELRKSSKAKRVSISIKNSRIRVAIPTGFTLEYAKNFLEDNKEWVLRHLQKQISTSQKITPKCYISGEKFLYRGRSYPLIIEETISAEYFAVFKGSRIVVYIPPDLDEEKKPQLVKNLIEEWYKGQAQKLLPEQVDYYAKMLNTPFNRLKIKDQKTRWGSCSNKGNINLNWRIIMAPHQVAAYVIIHELTHLKHMNHSKEFWKVVEDSLPDYKKWKKWLTLNGKELLT